MQKTIPKMGCKSNSPVILYILDKIFLGKEFLNARKN
jgi:hypothetical protein